jgi:hypothetical protein
MSHLSVQRSIGLIVFGCGCSLLLSHELVFTVKTGTESGWEAAAVQRQERGLRQDRYLRKRTVIFKLRISHYS